MASKRKLPSTAVPQHVGALGHSVPMPEAPAEGHTPTPWRLQLHFPQKYAGRSHAMITSGGDIVPLAAVVLGVEGSSEDVGRANAALIIRAVNAHAAMLAALELITPAYAQHNGETPIVLQARAAIALAKGEQST